MRTKIFYALVVALVSIFTTSFIYAQESSVSYKAVLAANPVPNADISDYYGDDGFGVPLKFRSIGRVRAGIGAADMARLRMSAVSSTVTGNKAYIDPYANYGLDLSYRNVEYIYGEDSSVPIGIVAISSDGIKELICEISVLIAIHAPGDENGIGPDIYNTRLHYIDEDGFDVTVTLVGTEMPNWDAILKSAAIADGVFYGMDAGGMITKARSEYDSNGNRIFAIMKTWKFDEYGNTSGIEVTKERSYYNNNGDLVSQSSYREVDGKITWVSNRYLIYIGRRLLMETKNTLKYNTDGTIQASTSEQKMFDANGNETLYILSAYENGHKTHYVKRETSRNDNGDVIYSSSEEIYYGENGEITSSSKKVDEAKYDSAGKLIMKRSFYQQQVRRQWGPFQGQLTTTYEAETITDYEYDQNGNLVVEHEHGYWFSTYVDPFFDRVTKFIYDYVGDWVGIKVLAGKVVSRIEAEDKDFTRVTYRFDERTVYDYDKMTARLTGKVTKSYEAWYDGSGNITRAISKSESEEYDDSGRITRKHHFYREEFRPQWGPFAGQLTTIREEETIFEYEYDQDGKLIKEHEFGYWFTTYVDPFFDRLTTFLYNMMPDGVKKLINKHISRIEAVDKEFINVTYTYEEDTVYNYDPNTGKLANVSTHITERNYSAGPEQIPGQVIISTREVDTEELYDNGRLINKSTIEHVNGELTFMEQISYIYHENGQIATTTRHTEHIYSQWYIEWEDEVLQYDSRGNLLLRSLENSNGKSYLEQRAYYADGTLLSVDIVSHEPTYWYWDGPMYVTRIDIGKGEPYRPGDYELHEKYRSDGKITYREEKSVQNYGGWYWYDYDIIGISDSNIEKNIAGMPPYWGGATTYSSVEKWDYSENGTLVHYEKEEANSSSGWYYNYYSYTVKTSRDYDSTSGKLVKEEYSIKGYNFNRFIKGYLKGVDLGDSTIPQDCKALIENITSYFFNLNLGSERKMTLEYGADGKITIKAVVNNDAGDTVSAFFGSVEYDANGKITAFKFSYTGEWQDQWKAMIEGLREIYPMKEILIPGPEFILYPSPVDPRPELVARLENNNNYAAEELAAQIDIQQQNYADSQGLTHELAARRDTYESLAQ